MWTIPVEPITYSPQFSFSSLFRRGWRDWCFLFIFLFNRICILILRIHHYSPCSLLVHLPPILLQLPYESKSLRSPRLNTSIFSVSVCFSTSSHLFYDSSKVLLEILVPSYEWVGGNHKLRILFPVLYVSIPVMLVPSTDHLWIGQWVERSPRFNDHSSWYKTRQCLHRRKFLSQIRYAFSLLLSKFHFCVCGFGLQDDFGSAYVLTGTTEMMKTACGT
jgi:hypothetical protein